MGLVNSAWDPLTVHNHMKIDLSKKIKIKPKRQTLGPETILNVCKMRKDTLEFG